MTITIGRVGLDIALSNPMARTASGSSVSLTGRLTAATASDAAVLREQMLGLVSGVERFVPVTFSDDARMSGYYAVTGLGVDDHPKSITSGLVGYAYSIDLVRATPSTSQLIQTVTYAAVRSNDDGIASTVGQFGVQVPYNSTLIAGVGASPWNTVQLEDDIVGTSRSLMAYQFTAASPTGPTVARWRIEPGNYYEGACKIETNTVGSTWRTVGGLVMRNDLAWRVSNGFVRVTADGPSLILEGAESAGVWSEAQTVTFTGDALTMPADGYWSHGVVRNDAWGTIVRQVGHTASGFVPVAMTVALRRGSRVVEVSIESSSPQSWGVGRDPDVAETALTAGWCATSATDGYKLVFAASPTSANAGSVCGITAAADTSRWVVGIGMSPSSASWQAPQDLVYAFLGGDGGGTTAGVIAG